MAVRPITGFGGGPVLNYDGTLPVAMESPCPYSQWDVQGAVQVLGDITTGAGWARFTVNAAGAAVGVATGSVQFRMIAHAQGGVIGATLTYSGAADNYAVTTTFATPIGAPGTISLFRDPVNQNLSGSFDVPYYRYRLQLQFGISAFATLGDWVQVDYTLT